MYMYKITGAWFWKELTNITKYDQYFRITFSYKVWFHEKKYIIKVKRLIFRLLVLTSNPCSPTGLVLLKPGRKTYVRLDSYLDQEGTYGFMFITKYILAAVCSMLLNREFIF